MKKKLTIFTGSGISAESGIPTFRASSDALWENYDVNKVCTHSALLGNPEYVNKFFNMLRVKYSKALPNDAHKLIASLEDKYDVTVITQNVDNLHEKAGSSNVLHLHGDIMKCCSMDYPEDQNQWIQLPKEGFGESGLEIPSDYESLDGSLLRPYIVLFEEPVPNYTKAVKIINDSDILVVIGTSLSVYPAAFLVNEFSIDNPLYIIDPGDIINDSLNLQKELKHFKMGASEGMKELLKYI